MPFENCHFPKVKMRSK